MDIFKNAIWWLMCLPLARFNRSQTLPEHNKRGIVVPRITLKKEEFFYEYVDSWNKAHSTGYIAVSRRKSLRMAYVWAIKWKIQKIKQRKNGVQIGI